MTNRQRKLMQELEKAAEVKKEQVKKLKAKKKVISKN